MLFDKNDKKNAPIVNFLKESSILIIDPNNTIRKTLKKLLIDLGVNYKNITSTTTFEETMLEFNIEKAQITFCNQFIDENHFSLLLKKHIALYPNRLQSAFFTFSEENSLASACEGLEHDVTAHIAQAFNLGILQEIILKTMNRIISASPLMKEIFKGQEFYYIKDYQQSLATFISIKEKAAKTPPIVHYFIAKLSLDQNAENLTSELRQSAILELELGLKTSGQHYKSLSLLGDLYLKEKNYSQAYITYQNLLKHFPLNPGLIPALIKLSLANNHYQDIIKFADDLQDEAVTDPLIYKFMGAGLVTAGSFMLQQNKTDPELLKKALSCFKRAYRFGEDYPLIVSGICHALWGQNMYQEAEKFIGLAENGKIFDHPEIQILKIEMLEKSKKIDQTIKEGIKLLEKGIHSIRMFEVMIKAAIKHKDSEGHISTLKAKAIANYPEQKNFFTNIS